MENIIVKFYNEQPVRIINQDGEPWFVAKDIAKILGYSSAYTMTKNLFPRTKCIKNIFDENLKRNIKTIMIRKSGVNSSIGNSNSTIACNFGKWLKNECLPYFYSKVENTFNNSSLHLSVLNNMSEINKNLCLLSELVCLLCDDIKILKDKLSDNSNESPNDIAEDENPNMQQYYLSLSVPEKLAEQILANNPHVIKV